MSKESSRKQSASKTIVKGGASGKRGTAKALEESRKEVEKLTAELRQARATGR